MSMSVSARRIPFLAVAILFAAITASVTVLGSTAVASGPLQITARSLTLEDGATDGGSKPSGVVKHLFTFTLPSSAAVQSLVFEYCKTADIDIGGSCVSPTGLSTTGAGVTAVNQSGDATTFTSLTNSTQGTLDLDAASGVAPGGSTSSTVEFDGVTNPDGTDCTTTPNNCTFYVNIQAWSGAGGTGTLISSGTVAASVNAQIQLTGTMPESLIFCTGATIPSTNSIPDCTQATSGAVSFNQLFSPTSTASATSQMAASTNANSGYVITVDGSTLKNGSYTIPAMGTTGYSVQGTPQFGMNLVKNTDFNGTGVDLGANVTQTGGTLYNGEALTGYATGGGNCTSAGCAQFTYATGASVADSLLGNGSPATGASDAQTYTASYIVNVSGSQAAGTYTTTLTYICTATY